MSLNEEQFDEKESLNLIAQMINKAKDSYRDTGTGAILWGIVIAVCSLVKLSELHFEYSFPFDVYGIVPLAALIPQIYITVKEKKGRKVKSYDEKFMDYIWLGFGICIALLIWIVNSVFDIWQPVGAEYRQLTGHASPFRFSEFVAAFFLLLYGLPTFITGAACRFRPMLFGGILCWVCCITSIYTPIKIDLLMLALSAIVAWLIPGLIMKKQYRVAKQQEALRNV